ncbi:MULTISPECIES: hypothetical protein [Mycolicibacterium]|uniref:ESX-1 secretion-associated protein EspH n=1 Tax=Mycolicibacterium senegalense TaxID=1796 RepID=A0A378T1R9_9MYCO|nr:MULTISPECIES: hypothetical protein [Mycolicibacterium]MCV7336286.1 hypothetical protein [Mycolicibacterium senegalense]MDR7290813.1 hypothetical protein [Mycolicibacterium senegalense]QZA22368.1 hypothetical protein K3U95_16540 [Mycolicibacterium senegalense]CDP89112.1 ESX-1 secretion-associated protein EspH [Mycolicibacterium farcinogenes]STZ53835.1 ESX-1 secretion-associated protein EspH [Mycolicibacterium senegalense]
MTDHTWDDDDPEADQFTSDFDALDFGDDRHSQDDHEVDWSEPDGFAAAQQPASDLDALDFGDDWSVTSAPAKPDHDDSDDGSDDESSGPVTFGVTNPAGTITAQATISGAINRIELSPSITSMTESDLARDIMATATLANLQGRAIQRAMVQSLLMHQGMDPQTAAQFIDEMIDLPTPAQAEAAQTEATAAYLRGER